MKESTFWTSLNKSSTSSVERSDSFGTCLALETRTCPSTTGFLLTNATDWDVRRNIPPPATVTGPNLNTEITKIIRFFCSTISKYRLLDATSKQQSEKLKGLTFNLIYIHKLRHYFDFSIQSWLSMLLYRHISPHLNNICNIDQN